MWATLDLQCGGEGMRDGRVFIGFLSVDPPLFKSPLSLLMQVLKLVFGEKDDRGVGLIMEREIKSGS